MGRVIAQKFFYFLFLLWFFGTVVFFLFRLLPGGPFDLEQNFSPVILEKINSYWGLQKPLSEQYFQYFSNLFHGNFGISYHSQDAAVSLLTSSLRKTVVLNSLALLLIVFGSLGLSYIIIRFQKSPVATVLEQVLILLSSFPSYFLAPFLVYFFCFYWELLPIAFLEEPRSYILPVIALSLRPLSQLSRLQVKNWNESLSQNYIRTAFAKGLAYDRILWVHGFRSSCAGFLAWLSPLVVGLYSGSFIVESLFSISGTGSLFVQSLSDRDYPVLMACSLFFGGSLILISSLSDILQMSLDPRLREEDFV